MFYSEAILSKKGPLARVWLAAHYEKKLTKNNIIQTSIQSATKEIREENHAPMALRLSGQLLLGVVKIYSRKARYLLEDCNDALLKIKMAFRPGQVDLSSATVRSAQAQAANLILPDTLTEFDLMGPDPGFDLNMDFDFDAPPTSTANISRAQDITLGERSIEFGRRASMALEEEEDDILAGGVDLDLDIGMDDGPSIEIGRDAAPERALSEEFDPLPDFDKGNDTTVMPDDDYNDMPMNDYNDDGGMGDFPMEDVPALPSREASAVPSDAIEAPVTRPARAKQQRKRRLQDDLSTELTSRSMKALQEDPTPLTKRPRRLPLDPAMLQLMQLSMQGQLGDLVWQPPHLHPNIRSLLMPEFVKSMARIQQQVADGEAAEAAAPGSVMAADDEPFPAFDDDRGMPAFDDSGMPAFDGDEGLALPDETLPEDSTEMALPSGDGVADVAESLRAPSPEEAFGSLDPLASDAHDSSVHESTLQANAAAGVVALDTATVVAQLMDVLGGKTQKARSSASTDFTTLAEGTSRAAASSLFFQVLLLATKDALKVEQRDAYGDISIKSKAGLYALSTEAGSQVAA
jgi:cohesin complex subunit SCC1